MTEIQTLDQLKNKFIDYFKTPLTTVAFAVEQALAVPGIAAEKFEGSAYATGDDLVPLTDLRKADLNLQKILMKATSCKNALYPLTYKQCGLRPSLEVTQTGHLDEVQVLDLIHRNYYTKNETAAVTVSDPDCGAVRVDVPYLAYHAVSEKKRIYYIAKKMSVDVVFSTNDYFDYNQFKPIYYSNNFYRFYDEKITISNFENLNSVDRFQPLLRLFCQFRTLAGSIKNTVNLRLDQEGLYVFVNDPAAAENHEKEILALFQVYAGMQL